MARDDDPAAVRREFHEAVNMTPKELEDWLDTEESGSVGQKDGSGESTGHEYGRRIVDLLQTEAADLGDDDLAAMRKVSGYVARHDAQRPDHSDDELAGSRWRYSLMNWGHDPLKD